VREREHLDRCGCRVGECLLHREWSLWAGEDSSLRLTSQAWHWWVSRTYTGKQCRVRVPNVIYSDSGITPRFSPPQMCTAHGFFLETIMIDLAHLSDTSPQHVSFWLYSDIKGGKSGMASFSVLSDY